MLMQAQLLLRAIRWHAGPVTIADRERTEDQLDAVMRASRVLVGIVARSLAELDGIVSVPQFRTLVLLAGSGQMNLKEVADQLAVHPSNATRVVDKLVTSGLVTRKEAARDRRYVSLDLTAEGHRLVDQVMTHRRDALRQVLATMTPAQQRALTTTLEAFADAAGESGAPAAEFVLQLPT